MMQSGRFSLPAAGILTSAGIILTYAELPMPFVPPFMKIDISDVPSLIGLFAMGFPAAVFITAAKDIIHLFVSESLGIGEICNFFVTLIYLAAFRALAPLSRKAGYGAAILAMTAAAAFLNAVVLLPLYFAAFHIDEAQLLAMTRAAGSPVSSMTDYILMAVVPFNLVKGTAIAVVSELLWKKLSASFRGSGQPPADHL